MIELNDLSHAYQGEEILLKNINLSISKGEIVVLMGASGCGKSTLLRLMCGLLEPLKGTVRINNKSPDFKHPEIGLMSQTVDLLPWLTVGQNIELGLKVTADNRSHKGVVDANLMKVSLGDKYERYPHELSGGEFQRVGIARLLAIQTETILMDEPFTALDFATRLRMHELLLELNSDLGKTIILITHQIEEAVLLADKIVYLSKNIKGIGKIFEILTPKSKRTATDSESLELQMSIKNLLVEDSF